MNVESMSEEELRREWSNMTKKKLPASAPLWLVQLGLEYHDKIKVMEESGRRVSMTMYRRYKLAKELDAHAIRAESDFLTPVYKLKEKETTMAKKKEGKKESKRTGPTAAAILVRLLGREHVPSDEAIIKEVKEETGSAKFDGRQLAWYKWKYKAGALKGMDGKAHTIAQGEPKKEKKVIIIKDRRKKELAKA